MTWKRGFINRSSTLEHVRSGKIGDSPDNPIDALLIGAGPTGMSINMSWPQLMGIGMVSLRNLLRNDPPLSVIAIDRQDRPGGIWAGHM